MLGKLLGDATPAVLANIVIVLAVDGGYLLVVRQGGQEDESPDESDHGAAPIGEGLIG
jgi:hypothetical protein